MLDEKRIKVAESNVRQYLQDNLLKKQMNETARVMYLENADLSLETAKKILAMENNDYHPYLWVSLPLITQCITLLMLFC